MKEFFKRIIYKLLLLIEQKTENAKIYYNSKSMILGRGSKLYKEASIHNLGGERSNIVVGENTHVRGELLTMNYGGKITVGDYCFVGEGCRLWSGEMITIGSHVLISHNVNIMDTNSHEIDHTERAEGYKNMLLNGHPSYKGNIKTARIVIEDYVWISFNSTILAGVTIGKGAIIGANSVVTKDIPPFTMVAGNPATTIRKLNETT